MKASLAYRELCRLAILTGVPGAAMVVARLTLVDDPRLTDSWYWAIFVVVLLLLVYWRGREMVRSLAAVSPAPEGVVVGGVSAHVPIELGLLGAGVIAGVLAPHLLGLLGMLFVCAATGHLTEAAMVGGWEQRHGGHVVRTGREQYYLAH